MRHLLPVAVRHFLRSYVELTASVIAVILFLAAAQTGCTHGKMSKLPTTRAAFRPLAVVITIVPESHTKPRTKSCVLRHRPMTNFSRGEAWVRGCHSSTLHSWARLQSIRRSRNLLHFISTRCLLATWYLWSPYSCWQNVYANFTVDNLLYMPHTA